MVTRSPSNCCTTAFTSAGETSSSSPGVRGPSGSVRAARLVLMVRFHQRAARGRAWSEWVADGRPPAWVPVAHGPTATMAYAWSEQGGGRVAALPPDPPRTRLTTSHHAPHPTTPDHIYTRPQRHQSPPTSGTHRSSKRRSKRCTYLLTCAQYRTNTHRCRGALTVG